MTQYKLGKLPAIEDPRTLKLAAYLNHAALPPIPDTIDWGQRVSQWPMYLNNKIGCCGIAGPAHLIQAWTANAQPSMALPTDQDVLTAYSAVSGYDPRTGANDNGVVLLNVLKYWRSVGIAGHKIGAFASIDPRDEATVRAGIFLFGGVMLGLALPLSAQDQIAAQRPWTISSGRRARPGTWGGHCVISSKCTANSLTDITWGAEQDATWEWNARYCDECYCLISQDWLTGGIVTPSGLDVASLTADLAAIAA